MKTKNILMITLLVIATCAIAVVSCTKEDQEKIANGKEKIVIDDDNMDEYLLAFKEKLLSAERGGETISLEQARRDLCNLLNFDFGDANNPTDIFIYDTLNVKLVLTDGFVNLSQLAVTYNEALALILDSYRALDLPDKSVYSICCEYNETSDMETNNIVLRIVVTYRGLFRDNPLAHDTLDWKPRRYSNSCDGTHLHIGAPEIMEQWIRDWRLIPECLDGARLYFTETEEDIYIQGYNTYDPIEGVYKIFSIFTYQIDTVCIPHEDMEYYYDNIIDYWEQLKPSGHVLINLDIQCFSIPYPQPNLFPADLWYWRVKFIHGKPNCTLVDPIH